MSHLIDRVLDLGRLSLRWAIGAGVDTLGEVRDDWAMPQTHVSKRDAEAYRVLIETKFAAWTGDDSHGFPKLIENWDGEGRWAICWDGPYEWAILAGDLEYENREPEFGFKLPAVPIPARLAAKIHAEPYYADVLVLYVP